jgi:heme-degrading monooxygenase HmoA
MIRSVLHLKPAMNRGPDVVRFFRDRRIVERALAFPGCLGVEIQTLLPDEDEVLVMGLWETAGHYQAWLDLAERSQDGAQMQHLLLDKDEAIGAAKLYQVTISARRGDQVFPPE